MGPANTFRADHAPREVARRSMPVRATGRADAQSLCRRRSLGRDRAVDLFGQVIVDLDEPVHFVLDLQERLGVLEGLQRLLVGGRGRNLLPHHDNRQQHQL